MLNCKTTCSNFLNVVLQDTHKNKNPELSSRAQKTKPLIMKKNQNPRNVFLNFFACE